MLGAQFTCEMVKFSDQTFHCKRLLCVDGVLPFMRRLSSRSLTGFHNWRVPGESPKRKSPKIGVGEGRQNFHAELEEPERNPRSMSASAC
jgi:hypothetical protein